MKPSDNIPANSKKPCVPANILKNKKKKTPNNSGDKSFLNKSKNHYMRDLRLNNDRLARSLTAEKKKTAILFCRHNESQAALLNYQVAFRSICPTLKNGIKKFNEALDSLIQASSYFSVANDKLDELSREIDFAFRESMKGGEDDINNTKQVQTSTNSSQADVTSSLPLSNNLDQPPNKGTPATPVSTIRQCTARPMVQGQIISKPTISLQRLAIPTRQLGKGMVKPARGVEVVSVCDKQPTGLCSVPEEMNESNERSPLSKSVSKTYESQKDKSPRLQSTVNVITPSHVLLERIPGFISVGLSDPCVSSLPDDDYTGVIFGSMNFSDSPCQSGMPAGACLSPQKLSCAQPDVSSNGTVDASLCSSNSEEYETESSSEEESVALQILEFRRNFFGRAREVESKEGTSWNYDEHGRFHEQPPKKRKSSRRMKASRKMTSKVAVQPKESSRQTRDLSHTPTEATSNTSPQAPVTSDDLSTTVYEGDMSFTCVEKLPLNVMSEIQVNGRSLKDGTQELDKQQIGQRKAYVTQRSRHRMLSPTKCELSNPTRSPTKNTFESPVRNKKSSPGSVTPSGMTGGDMMKTALPTNSFSPNPSYVVLERLPSNITTGRNYHIATSDQENANNIKKNAVSWEGIVPELEESMNDSICDGDTSVICRKRRLIQRLSSYSSDECIYDTEEPQEKNRNVSEKKMGKSPSEDFGKPGRKQQSRSKKRRKCLKALTGTNEHQSGATTGCKVSLPEEIPIKSETKDSSNISATDSSACRPRRNAAPTSMKEPKLIGKLRRP